MVRRGSETIAVNAGGSSELCAAFSAVGNSKQDCSEPPVFLFQLLQRTGSSMADLRVGGV